MDPRERYQSYLSTKSPGAELSEDTAFAMGSFRYFYVPSPRGKSLEAAASPLTLVTFAGAGDWVAFLESGSALELGKRIAWLAGNPSLVGPESLVVKQLPAEVAARVKEPVITLEKKRGVAQSATFVGYFLFQPGSQVLKLNISATHEGAQLSWEEP